MAKYPIKVLLDELKRPFFPLVTIDTIVMNNSDKTLMQLFEERYTKAEVDKLISDLGTLQRLRGTVATYEELLAIEDPMPGDTYILLVEGGNNAEYMYIGDKWEALGPTASYTDVYGKEDIDGMLLALKQELNTKTERDDAEVLAQAKLYAEDLFANVPAPNLDEYYKKSETDAKIDEKINAIPVNNLWHYKGHFATKDDLPSTGQASGVMTTNNYSNNSLPQFKTSMFTCPLTEKNFYGTIKNALNYYLVEVSHTSPYSDMNDKCFGFATNHPEMIKGISIYQNSNSRESLAYLIEYDENKPVYYMGACGSGGGSYDNGTFTKVTANGSTQLSNSAVTSLQLVTETSLFYKSSINYSTGAGRIDATYGIFLFTNIPQLKFIANSSLPFAPSGMFESFSTNDLNGNVYYYNDGMILFRSDENEYARFLFNEALAKVNDVATVGEHHDLYRCNDIPKWVPINERVESSGGTGVVINRWEGVA